MRQPSWRMLRAFVPVAIVVLAALWVYIPASAEIRYSKDEGDYIRRSAYFRHLFLEGNLDGPEWQDSYDTHTQPMLANYIVGAWLWARAGWIDDPADPLGRLAEDLIEEAPTETQERTLPTPLIAQVRPPMVLLAVAVVLALYWVGRMLAGPVAGGAAAILLLANPLFPEALVRALPDTPLVLLLLVALALGVLGARRGRGGSLPVVWATLLGMTLGLAWQAKLTAALSLAAVGIWGILVAGIALWRTRDAGDRGWSDRAQKAGRGWALALAVAVLTFVATNPHLYPDPLGHTIHLFQWRSDAMDRAVDRSPARGRSATILDLPAERVGFVFGGSLVGHTAAGSYGLPIEAALAVIGAAALSAWTWRGWRRTGQVPPEGLVLATVIVYFVGSTVLMSLARPRYLVPTILLGTLLSGVGLAVIASQLEALAAALRRKRRPLESVAPQQT